MPALCVCVCAVVPVEGESVSMLWACVSLAAVRTLCALLLCISGVCVGMFVVGFLYNDKCLNVCVVLR